GCTGAYDDILYQCKKLVILRHFTGDVDNLTWLFKRAINKRPYGRDCTFHRLRKAIVELLASSPVYRTYLSEKDWEERDVRYIKLALLDTKQRNLDVIYELEAIERLLEEGRFSEDALRCFIRLQQFTGSIMAKGLEDTTLYVFNRLISLNEVGSDPSIFALSIDDFHEFNKVRRNKWPFSINATSTHDTKRGEDVRARLNVLSEVPSEWGSKVKKWAELNFKKKERVGYRLVPDKNEEYYIYQTLIGAFPFDLCELPEFTERIKAHMVKVVREAKVNSSWLEPDIEYEQAITSFVSEVLDSSDRNDFLQDFLPFQEKIAYYGVFNSISQTLLKITCPGVPDFYQGGELWDLNLVDPDNRRPVDFRKRMELLAEVLEIEEKGQDRMGEFLRKFKDGRIKLYEVYKSLKARKRRKELFEEGDYIPLIVEGTYKEHVIAFCRRRDREWAMSIVPRFLTGLIEVGGRPLGSDVWKDTYIRLPENAPYSWEEVFTGRDLRSIRLGGNNALQMGEVLESFPVALLLDWEG
ncbi:MAG: malto-oligosyltrehalose synthase, partial [archaeon]|nr:malto-oligosyltrehalose synthase [archaeon]